VKRRVLTSSEKRERDYRGKWQRVLRAYLALQTVRSLTDGEPHTPALARLVEAKHQLAPGDLEIDR
jgi:hypothetical protein